MGLIRVGIVGTGYAAKCRASAFAGDERSLLVTVSGDRETSRQEFAEKYGVRVLAHWQDLVRREDIDLVTICNINREHGAVAKAALEAGKNVVVEYPLALNPNEAEELIDLAQSKNKLLHVEHIEILGGLHQTIREYLPYLGRIYFARYMTLAPKRYPLPHWTFHHEDYGFPLIAALSRVNRLIDLFGGVQNVTGTAEFFESEFSGYFQSCLCGAQFRFENGVIAHLTYGKGSLVQAGDRCFSIYGDQGTLEFKGSKGKFIQGDKVTSIELGGRRGVFKRDTTAVLDYLNQGTPLYIQPEQSLYALQIADQIRQSAMVNL